jgi:hypothetical protein
MNISIRVMAHQDRAEQAIRLYNQLAEMPFYDCRIEWDNSDSEWQTGKAAWLSQKGSDWSIVIQDDAIVSEEFYVNISRAIKAVPQETCISFYLGATRPYNNAFTRAFNQASDDGASWLAGKSLHHGVCVAMPTNTVESIIRYVGKSNLQYDHRIGSYFQKHKLPVYYTMPSLCDHNDDLPSITNHKVSKARVARMYQPEFVSSWNDKVIEIGV